MAADDRTQALVHLYRRLQFIEPYVRGGGPLLQHVYKLDGAEEQRDA